MTKPLPHNASASEQIQALHLRTRALAIQVADQAMCLSITQGALSALDKLITPEYLADLEENIDVPRWELGALVNLVSAELKRQINDLNALASAHINANPIPNPGQDPTS